MHYSKRKIVAVFFAVVVIVTAFSLFFGTKKAPPLSFREAACAFENSEASCIDSLDAWKNGLLYFDSLLAVTGDTVGAGRNVRKTPKRFFRRGFSKAASLPASGRHGLP